VVGPLPACISHGLEACRPILKLHAFQEAFLPAVFHLSQDANSILALYFARRVHHPMGQRAIIGE
jgi:hypothetical protein